MARQMANFARLMDGVVYTTFLMFVSGFGLFLLGELYKGVVQRETKKLSQIASVVVRLFPFPEKKYEFNLTHVVVFSMLIGPSPAWLHEIRAQTQVSQGKHGAATYHEGIETDGE